MVRALTLTQLSLTILVLVDFPVTAEFLTPEERAYVVWRKSAGSTFSSCLTEPEQSTIIPRLERKNISRQGISSRPSLTGRSVRRPSANF